MYKTGEKVWFYNNQDTLPVESLILKQKKNEYCIKIAEAGAIFELCVMEDTLFPNKDKALKVYYDKHVNA